VLSLIILVFPFKFKFKKKQCRKLPKYPSREKDNTILGSFGEESTDGSDFETKTRATGWVRLPLSGLSGSLLIFGSIRSGKTASIVKNVLDDLLNRFEVKLCGLILDPKKTFADEAIELIVQAKNYGRGKILHLTAEANSFQINPLYREKPLKDSNYLESSSLIEALIYNSYGESGNSKLWNNAATNLSKIIIAYLSATCDYYTFYDVKNLLEEIGSLNEKDNKYRQAIQKADSEEKEVLAARPLPSEEFVFHLERQLNQEKFDEEEKHNIKNGISAVKSFLSYDSKLRTSVIFTLHTVLSDFGEYSAFKTFSPNLKEFQCSHIKTVDDILEKEKFLVFDIKNEKLAKSMGIVMKISFQQAILNRYSSQEKLAIDKKRNRRFLILADEAQEIITCSSQATSDNTFLAKAGQVGAITIYSTHNYNSILSACLGNESLADNLVYNFRSIMCTHSIDPKTFKIFQTISGKKVKSFTSTSMSENNPNVRYGIDLENYSSSANLGKSLSESEREAYEINENDLSKLKTFTAYGAIFDGITTRFSKIYLRPHFVDRKVSYRKSMILAKKKMNFKDAYV
jgi:hypothetical protein